MSPQPPSKAPEGGTCTGATQAAQHPAGAYKPLSHFSPGCLLLPSQKERERSPLPVLVPAASKPVDQEVSISASKHLTELPCPRGTCFATCTLGRVHSACFGLLRWETEGEKEAQL